MKKIVLGLLIMAVAAGAISAQQTASVDFYTGNGFNLRLNESFMGMGAVSGFSANPALTPFAANDMPHEPWGWHPGLAGLVNTVFGIWSWTNGDTFGGALTAGLQLGGIILPSLAFAVLPRTTGFGLWGTATALGTVAWVSGTVFGFVRGFSQYNRMMAAFTNARDNTPLANASLVILPTFDDRRVIGSLTYSLSF